MITQEPFLNRLITWAEREDGIRRLLLVGSRAGAESPDELADFDLQVYTRSHSQFTGSTDWLSEFGNVLVCVPDSYTDGAEHVPTRLVIFESGVKVDFAFYEGTLSTGVRSGRAYRTLLQKDRDSLPLAIPLVSTVALDKPTATEFRRVVDEFWFEAYHAAKYLARNELWLAKARDWAMKQFLMTMIGWHEQFARGRLIDPHELGKRGSMGADTWRALGDSFTGHDEVESWDAIFSTARLFLRLTTETATSLNVPHSTNISAQSIDLIRNLRTRNHRRPAAD